MKAKNKIWIAIGALVVLIAIVVINILPNEYEKMFVDNGKNEPYAQGVPLHEMDFEVYEDYILPIAPVDYYYEREIELPCDIEYYASKEDSEPVLIYKKGTTVYVMGKDDLEPIGYGVRCWPDYEKEWRYGYPFFKTDFRFIPDGAEMYYVKSEQLEKVAGAFYKINKTTLSNFYGKSQYIKFTTQYIDVFLYRGGAYLSESLRDE